MIQAKVPLLHSFSTLGCPKATWAEAAGLAKSYGFGGIELRALRGRIDLPRVLEEEFQTPENMAGICGNSGIRAVALDSSLSLFGGREEQWLEVAELAVWADASGIPFLRVFDGGKVGEGCSAEAGEVLRRGLEKWSALRRDRNFKCDLMIETHGVLANSEDCVRFAERCGGRLHLLWDVCHTWHFGGTPPLEDWKVLRPWVRHIHVKDAVRDASARSGLRHVLPGTGEIPVRPLLEELAGTGFGGPVSLEWELFWNPGMESLEEALEAGRIHHWW